MNVVDEGDHRRDPLFSIGENGPIHSVPPTEAHAVLGPGRANNWSIRVFSLSLSTQSCERVGELPQMLLCGLSLECSRCCFFQYNHL